MPGQLIKSRVTPERQSSRLEEIKFKTTTYQITYIKSIFSLTEIKGDTTCTSTEEQQAASSPTHEERPPQSALICQMVLFSVRILLVKYLSNDDGK
jgi:hypothetical protein